MSWLREGFLSILCVAAIAAAPSTNSVRPAGGTLAGATAQDVRYPNYDKEGVLRSDLTGRSAVTRIDGGLTLSDFVLTLYGTRMSTVIVQGTTCDYDSASKTATSESDVAITFGKTVMRGTGFTWRGIDDMLAIWSNATVQISDPGQWSPAGLSAESKGTGSVTVTASEMDFMPQQSLAFFRQNVRVTDGAAVMTGNEAHAVFNEDCTLKATSAFGDVIIIDTGSTGTASQAFMDMKTDKVILLGNARIDQADETIAGDRITVLRRVRRVIVDAPTLNLKDFADPLERDSGGNASKN